MTRSIMAGLVLISFLSAALAVSAEPQPASASPYVLYPYEREVSFEYDLDPGEYYFVYVNQADEPGGYSVEREHSADFSSDFPHRGGWHLEVSEPEEVKITIWDEGVMAIVASDFLSPIVGYGSRVYDAPVWGPVAWAFFADSRWTYLCLDSEAPVSLRTYGWEPGTDWGLRDTREDVTSFEAVFDSDGHPLLFVTPREPGALHVEVNAEPCGALEEPPLPFASDPPIPAPGALFAALLTLLGFALRRFRIDCSRP